ncbi:NAD(P)-binding protein, partial [Trematosphaeria pertusa]
MPPVPPGSLILVTGGNGYIAGVTIQKLLAAGFRVRGTVRDASRYDWMPSQYGPNFSLVEIADMAAPGAFDEAVKGVDGIAHIASPVVFVSDPQAVIVPAIQNAVGLLEAAAKEESVKSVVYTSSKAACVQMEPNKPYHITQSSYNEDSKAAWTLPVTADFARAALNYCCAKTESEQRCFKWVQENKPHFTFNTVVPNVNFGTVTRPDKTGFISSSGILRFVWEGNLAVAAMFPPEWFVDVEDSALLHIAVLTQPDVQNERLFAFAGPFCYKEILEIFRKSLPERKFADDPEEVLDCGTVDNTRSVELLKRMGKENGFSSLEEAVRKWIPLMLK